MQSDKSYDGGQPSIKTPPYFFLMTSCDRSGKEDEAQVSRPGSAGLCHWWGCETATAWDRINLGRVTQKRFGRQPRLAAASFAAAVFLFCFVFSLLDQESHKQSFNLKSLIPACIAVQSGGE